MKTHFIEKLLVAASLAIASSAFAATPIEADLLASYAASYATSVGGEDNAQVIIANTVAGNNAIQDQGGTGARMRIAGFYQSANDVTGQTTTGGIVNWLSGNDAHLSDVVARADAVGADIVVYICNNSDSGSIAGVSQQPGRYSALNPGAVWSGVFAHETGGHAYGRSHSDGILNPKTIMLHNYCGGGAAPPYFYTNPNIWFNGVQLLGDGVNNCSMGGLVNGGDNSSCSAQAVADRNARVITGPNLNNVVLRWSFTNAAGSAPASTTITDQVSGASAIVRGTGAAFTGKGLRIPGTTTGNVAINSMAAYIDLPNGIISSQTNITIEIWATPLSAANWGRVCDFGRPVQAGDGLGAPGEYTGTPGTAAPGTTSSSDDIMLSFSIGTDLNSQRFESKLNGANTVTLDSGLATTAGVQHHYAITFTDGAGSAGSAGGRWQWFRDGDAVAYLDVTNHLSAIEDVNNWLGRSMWTADNNANVEYAEVRISSAALSRGEILANFLLGPNYVPTATVTLNNSDASGSTSFNAAGHWSNGAAPSAGNSYETFDFLLRTPATTSSYNFGGDSLKISGGALLWKGTASSSITVNNLTLNGGALQNAGSGTCTLAGGLNITTNGGTINAVNNNVNISAPISGSGPLTFLANNVTLSGNNSSFTGKISIGNGQPGTLAIDSPARLGTSPATFAADQLTLNRGTLQTTATMSLNDANRGILLDVSGGRFNVNSGTTLTLASTLSTPVTASGIVVGSITKTGGGTLILASPGNAFKGTLYVDTGASSGSDGIVRVANNQVLASAHSPMFIRNTSSGSSTLQLDGSSGAITLPQSFAVNCRASSIAAIQNLAGTNTLNGSIALNNGGSFFTLQSDSGQLTLNGAQQYVGSSVGTRIHNFTGTGDIRLNGAILNATNGSTINLTKSGTGTLTLTGANTYAGATSVSSGTLLVNGSIGAGSVNVFGTIGGTGLIKGPVTLQFGGVLSPGPSIGTLTIGNTLTLNANSTTLMEISKAGASLASDLVQGLTSVFYDGILIVTNIGSTNFSAGDVFQLFSSSSYNQSFSSVTLPPLASNLIWTNRLAIDGTIAVVSAVSLTPSDVSWNFGGTNLTLSWPDDHVGWRLIVQTNNLASGLSLDTNDWATVDNSQTTNNVNLPVQPDKPAEFFRLIYP